MSKIVALFVGSLLCIATPAVAQDLQDPAAAAQKARDDAWAKAVKDKARSDAIVEQQRAAERAAKAKNTSPTPTGTATPK